MPQGYDLQDEVAIAMNHVVPIGGRGGFGFELVWVGS
mgnify:CR=1 FL=1